LEGRTHSIDLIFPLWKRLSFKRLILTKNGFRNHDNSRSLSSARGTELYNLHSSVPLRHNCNSRLRPLEFPCDSRINVLYVLSTQLSRRLAPPY
ncbi:hypothetical protein SFRURICE_001842, partial [Spodoptera frugiperda]